MKVAATWAILLALPALAFFLHRHRTILVRIGAAIGGLLAAPMVVGLVFPESNLLRGSVPVALIGAAIYAASLALARRIVVVREEREANARPTMPVFIPPEPNPPTMKGISDPAPDGPQPRPAHHPEPAPVAPEPVDLAVTGWPDFTREHAAEPSPPPDPPALPEPVAAVPPSEPEPVAPPAKRGRGRPRKTAAKEASLSPVVKSEPMESSRAAEIDAAAAAAVEQATLDPAPPLKATSVDPPAIDGPSLMATTPLPHLPLVHVTWSSGPSWSAPTGAASVVAPAQRARVTPFEWLLSRPVVVEGISPSGVMRLRIVGWPERLLTTYRALQIGTLLVLFVYAESIFLWLGARVGERSIPLATGAAKGFVCRLTGLWCP